MKSSAPTSVINSRLAYFDGTTTYNWTEDPGLCAAKDAAFEWQDQRSWAHWHELVAMTNLGPTGAWVPEAHGLLGVVGEKVIVAIEAEVEKRALVDGLAAIDPAEEYAAAISAGRIRSLRFFAESQGNELVVAGHNIANLALRTLALAPAFSINSVARDLNIEPNKFAPGSRHRGAWTSLNLGTATAIKDAADQLGDPGLQGFADCVLDLVKDQKWAQLVTLRNNGYHRWRGETPGVTGVTFDGPRMQERLDNGEIVGIGVDLLPPYDEADDIVTEIVDTTRGALDCLAQWMPGALTLWGQAVEPLLNPPAP